MTPPLDHILSPQAQQAVIAGVFLSVGWWVVAWQNHRRDARHRAERVRDVQRALFAEIRAYLAALQRDDIARYGEDIAQKILLQAGYFPVIPTERNDAIFRAIVGEIHVLPRDTVDPIVLYYSQLNAIGAMIDDLRALDVGRIGAERAVAMYRDYIAMKIEAMIMAETALQSIRNNMDGRGTPTPSVSNPAAGRSGR